LEARSAFLNRQCCHRLSKQRNTVCNMSQITLQSLYRRQIELLLHQRKHHEEESRKQAQEHSKLMKWPRILALRPPSNPLDKNVLPSTFAGSFSTEHQYGSEQINTANIDSFPSKPVLTSIALESQFQNQPLSRPPFYRSNQLHCPSNNNTTTTNDQYRTCPGEIFLRRRESRDLDNDFVKLPSSPPRCPRQEVNYDLLCIPPAGLSFPSPYATERRHREELCRRSPESLTGGTGRKTSNNELDVASALCSLSRTTKTRCTPPSPIDLNKRRPPPSSFDMVNCTRKRSNREEDHKSDLPNRRQRFD